MEILTTVEDQLKKLDKDKIKFITIRRRGKLILDRIAKLHVKGWKDVKVECAGNKTRTLHVYDEKVFLNGYDKEIRQITLRVMEK